MDNLIKRMRMRWISPQPPTRYSLSLSLPITLELPISPIYRFESRAISFAFAKELLKMLNYKIKVWHMSIGWGKGSGGWEARWGVGAFEILKYL